MLSYANGASKQPLLGQTIGDNFERTVARVPDAEALVSCHQQLRYTYAELNAAVDRLASGDAPSRARNRATGSASGARTEPSGR